MVEFRTVLIQSVQINGFALVKFYGIGQKLANLAEDSVGFPLCDFLRCSLLQLRRFPDPGTAQDDDNVLVDVVGEWLWLGLSYTRTIIRYILKEKALNN